MSEKRYQISPIELVQWAEPLFGFGEGKATGFSEKTIASYEAAAGIRLPAALREYYLVTSPHRSRGRARIFASSS